MYILPALIFFSSTCFAQTTNKLYEQHLIQEIYKTQSKGDNYFAKGLFPTYREYYYFNKGAYKNDDNIFFTALIIATLQELKPKVGNSLKNIIDSVINNALPAFKKFQNRRGFPVYSFWMTTPKKYFPNSWLSIFKTNALSDDLDCSSIVLQATNPPHSMVKEMHQYIQSYTNGKKQKVLSTFKDYRKLPAYSTWLSHKIPTDFDVCALSNVLVLVHKYNLKYTAADSASLKLVCEAVRKRQYQTHPEIISPYYNRSPVILYHISRLMSTRFIPELEKYKNDLIADAQLYYQQANSFLDKIILSTSLLRWGVLPPDQLQDQFSNLSDNNFVFFVANMAAMLPNPFTRFMIKTNIGRFDYFCPAYNNVLVLENVILRNQTQQ